jgi:hypothetical protein
MKAKNKAKAYFLNEDASGSLCVSKRPLNQLFYSTPMLLYCIKTKAKKITRNGVFAGAICITIHGEILKIVELKNRAGYERDYSKLKKNNYGKR